MTAKLLLLLVCLISFLSSIKAQDPEIEELLEQHKEYSDISDLLEMLAELEQNPIDLNRATAEQLAVLPWISNVLAIAIINYRDQIKGFNSIEDLARLDNINPDLIPILKKYITVHPINIDRQISFTTKTRLSRKFEAAASSEDSAAYRSPTKVYHRFNLNYGNDLRVGLLLEKDSGERQMDDLNIYYLSYQSHSNNNKLIIGNYRLEFAQGLVFGNPYGYYKGSDPVYPAKRRGRALLEYSLVDENASLYGISAQVCFKIYQFFLFLSSAKLDATLNDDGTVKNFYISGYHRSANEMEKKDQLTERLAGYRVVIKPASFLALGTTYYQSLYHPALSIQDDNLYRFDFKGKANQLIGIDFNLTLAQFNLFGELARSENNGIGLLAGVLTEFQRLELVILGRNYSKNFISYHGSSFGERGDKLQNELGIFWGFQFKPAKSLKLGIYFDQFKFPWRSYFIPMPSNGTDFFLRAEYRTFKNLLISLQYKLEQKEQNISEINRIVPRHQNRLRAQLEFRPSRALILRCRIEKNWVTYQLYKGLDYRYPRCFQGVLLYQDMIVKLKHNFDLAARLTFFDTDSYESRVYQFEQDIPGLLTNQMLQGTGTRGYLRIQWRINEMLNLSLKLGSTQYHFVSSTGGDTVTKPGRILHSINLQLETNW